MRKKNFRGVLARNAVTLAVYRLADATGARCSATYGELSRESGVSVGTVAKHLRAMELDGTIAVFWVNREPNHREILILDNPKILDHIRKVAVEEWGVPNEESWAVMPAYETIWREFGGRRNYMLKKAAEVRNQPGVLRGEP